MKKMHTAFWLILLSGLLLISCRKDKGQLSASASTTGENNGGSGGGNNGPYFPNVRTIIQNNCLVCHSSTGSWAGRPTAFDSDNAIAAQSAAIKASVADPITATNQRMPEGGTLAQSDIDMIVKWFNKGGKTTD